MKFNEKLIKLRKEQGLSQEELGERLDVTRQTVSKWELGETTPEMSKLLEIANVFGVTVDDLTNDTDLEKKKYNAKDSKSTRNIVIIVILIVVLAGTVYIAAGKLIGGFFKMVNNQGTEIKGQAEEIQNQAKGIFGTVVDQMKQAQAEYDNEKIESAKRSFNLDFELRDGTQWNSIVQDIIDEVIDSNQKNEKKVSVYYNNTETAEAAELRQMKRNFDSSKKYEIYLEYDNEGYVNKVVIENI